jgi:hypothetical protein
LLGLFLERGGLGHGDAGAFGHADHCWHGRPVSQPEIVFGDVGRALDAYNEPRPKILPPA